MAKLLFMTTHSTDDPTRAAMAFILANGAKEAGHEPLVSVAIDGVYLMKDQIVASITPVGFPPLKEIMATTVANGTPIYVWGGWARARGVTDQDLAGKNAKMMNPRDFANLVAEADKVVSF